MTACTAARLLPERRLTQVASCGCRRFGGADSLHGYYDHMGLYRHVIEA